MARYEDCTDAVRIFAQAADESVLTPRFYTTDFDEMEQLFSLELNPNLNMEELEVGLTPVLNPAPVLLLLDCILPL